MSAWSGRGLHAGSEVYTGVGIRGAEVQDTLSLFSLSWLISAETGLVTDECSLMAGTVLQKGLEHKY